MYGLRLGGSLYNSIASSSRGSTSRHQAWQYRLHVRLHVIDFGTVVRVGSEDGEIVEGVYGTRG
jgi:hypothetical protein